MALEDCRIVLVRPRIAANIGASARVMRNMGLGDLVLVAPEADPSDPEAKKLSARGEEVLQNCRIVDDLGAAVADCLLVVGTSARIGGPFRRQSVGRPDEIMPRLAAALQGGPAAIVFGPERTGLTDEEVTRCNYLVHIPADETYPALNLAQAIAICAYTLRCAWLAGEAPVVTKTAAAPFADQERMFGALEQALQAIHFLYGPSAGALMHSIRHLIGRAQPTPMEVDVLLGLARQLRWFASQRDVRGNPLGE